MLSRVKLF
ncbi:hypothetical protein VCHENC02_2839A, partial [Vibrio harveyi]